MIYICIHCGNNKGSPPRKGDHVFPRCVNKGCANPPRVSSCPGPECNGTSKENMLEAYLSTFDIALRPKLLAHYSQGVVARKDLEQHVNMMVLLEQPLPNCNSAIFADNNVLDMLRKMIQGVRKLALGEAWSFKPRHQIDIATQHKDVDGDLYWIEQPTRQNPFYIPDILFDVENVHGKWGWADISDDACELYFVKFFPTSEFGAYFSFVGMLPH